MQKLSNTEFSLPLTASIQSDQTTAHPLINKALSSIDSDRSEIISKAASTANRASHLPVELWHTIFDLLELTDLPSCALVCKTLYSVVKAYRVREIAFTRRVYEWFHPDYSAYRHWLDYSMASLLNRSSFSLEHLKRLKIGRASAIDLNEINNFANLEELDIDLANYENEKSSALSLANLKVLYLFMSDHLPYLELDTPRLERVCTFSLKKLDFLHPDSVRCIHTFFHCGRLFMFRNLEYLLFTDRYNKLDYSDDYDSKSFNRFSLSSLKKLKEIDFFFCTGEFEENNFNEIQAVIANVLALRRPDLKVFWHNMQVADLILLTEYKQRTENLIAFQFKHFGKLKGKVDFFWDLDFNVATSKLTEAGHDLRSEEFTSKFFTLFSFREIEVTGKVNEEELLLEIIARSPRLWSLKFFGSDLGLGQSFFDRMANTVRLNGIPLRHLKFEEIESLGFDFVRELRDLEWFKTDQPLPPKLSPKLLTLPSITKIEFSSGSYWIERMPTGTFWLYGESLKLQLFVRSV